MSHVLTLVAGAGPDSLPPSLIERATQALAEAGAAVADPDWLSPARACDLAFEAAVPAAASLRDLLAGAAVDFAVQPQAGRRKALLVADMDSTIVTSETLDELADALGLKAEIAAITARTMAGELDFAQALRARVARLAGLPSAALDRTLARIELSPGARALVRTMKAHGTYCLLVSGGFSHFTSAIREACGFDEDRSNHLVLENGQLTGEVAEPILGREAKLEILRELVEARGITLDAACAVGDGANDLAMLQAAGLGVAYRGKPATRAAARFCVDHGDLTALLYFQGYRESEFVT